MISVILDIAEKEFPYQKNSIGNARAELAQLRAQAARVEAAEQAVAEAAQLMTEWITTPYFSNFSEWQAWSIEYGWRVNAWLAAHPAPAPQAVKDG